MLAFEDMQWADTSLLDFVEYLLEWSRDYPLFVITLARPELPRAASVLGRRPAQLHLALPRAALRRGDERSSSTASCPALPDALRDQILDRAEGVPLYAVETVRMLLDRGLLAHDGASYRLTGEIETLEVPETLHALIAARLDGSSPEERRLLQDGAVLGKTFTQAAIAALSGLHGRRARAAPRPPSSARRCSASSPTRARPSTASTASSRTSSATSPTRRSRSASARPATSRPPSTSSRPSERRRDRRGARLPLPGRGRGRARSRGRHGESATGHGACSRGGRARGVARRARRGPALLRTGGRARRRCRRRGSAPRASGKARGPGRPRGRRPRRSSNGRSRSTRRRETRARLPLASVGLGDIDVFEGKLDEAARRFEAALPALEATG